MGNLWADTWGGWLNNRFGGELSSYQGTIRLVSLFLVVLVVGYGSALFVPRRKPRLWERLVGGGVGLARDPAGVTLFELCAALDDPIVETRCMLEQTECSDERACPAHSFWVAHRDEEVEFLRRTTIQDMAAFELDSEARNGNAT